MTIQEKIIKIIQKTNNKKDESELLESDFERDQILECCGAEGFYSFTNDSTFNTETSKTIIQVIFNTIYYELPYVKLYLAITKPYRQKTATHTFRYLASEIIKFKGQSNGSLELYIMHRKDLVKKLNGEKTNDST